MTSIENTQSSKATCYVDVTQLVHWQGHVTGIPRVMYELSKRFTEDDSTRLAYVSWVKEIAQFCEIDFIATMDRRGEGIVYLKDEGSSPTQKTNKPLDIYEVFKPIKRLTKRVIERAGLSDVALVKRAQNNLAAREAETYRRVAFTPGDSIFISWGEWWDENFLACLERGVQEQKLKIIPVIHDVLPFTGAPHFSGHSTDSLAAYCRRVVPLSAFALCVSNSTKNDLTKWLQDQKITIPPMRVFRLGEDFEFAAAERPTEKTFVNSGLKGGDYMLTVGTVEARKNHTLLYYVHKLAVRRSIELPVSVIVGRRGWKTEQIYDFMTQDPEVKDKFVFLHDASDENLSWLYDHAKFSIFPSFCEGWGMPIAESIARGVPCACSDTTSMIEIAEEYVDHFSPASTDECLAVIQKMLDPIYLESRRTQCATYRQTTWDDSFAQVREHMKEFT